MEEAFACNQPLVLASSPSHVSDYTGFAEPACVLCVQMLSSFLSCPVVWPSSRALTVVVPHLTAKEEVARSVLRAAAEKVIANLSLGVRDHLSWGQPSEKDGVLGEPLFLKNSSFRRAKLSTTELESGNAPGAFLQTPLQYCRKYLNPWVQDFYIQYWL